MGCSKLVLAAAAVVMGLASATAARAGTDLTYGSFLPAPHLVHREGLEPFFERVKKDSGGEIDWTLVPGGAMGGTKEAVQVVRDRVVDGGLLLDIYQRRELPVSSMFADLIVLPDDFMIYAAAANEMQLIRCAACIAEKAGQNMVALAYYAPDPYKLMCRDETGSLADLRNKKTRATGRLGVLMQHFGATPVTITSSEVYEALERGQADCTVASNAWLKSYNLKDVVTSIIDLPMGSYFNAALLVMNKDRLAGLSDAEKQAIVKNLPKLVVDALFAYRAESRQALDAAEQAGVAVHEPDAAMRQALEAFRQGELDNAVAAADAAGIEGARQRIDTYLGLVEKWRGIFEKAGGDRAAIEAALRDEVFSKLEL